MGASNYAEETWEEAFASCSAPAPLRPRPRFRPGDELIEIDCSMAGKIIGKNGTIINGLRQASRAYISIVDSEIYGLKIVKISGSSGAKSLAKKLVQDVIDANTPKYYQLGYQETDWERQTAEITYGTSNMALEVEPLDWEEIRKDQEKQLQERLATMPRIVKSFYTEHPEVTKLSDKQVDDFRLSKNNIMVKYIDENNNLPIPKPVLTFTHAFKDYPEILREIRKQNFEIPSPVQCQAWPIIMNGHDLIAVAQTGTGKTLAFLLPAFIHIDSQSTPRHQRKGPTVLVLAPTRELVVQIENEVKKYRYKGIRSISVYGGTSAEKQQEMLMEGVEIVIATPGRLNDFVNRGLIDLTNVSLLILDEADRMLDLGFEPQIRVSLLTVRPDRQTIMTSATWPSGVKRLAKTYTNNPIQITIGSLDLTTVNTVKQEVLIMEEEHKYSWLLDFLENITEEDKVIIFVNRKMTVDELSLQLSLKGLFVDSIHGGREQSDREMSLDHLRSGETRILIATDVASRGIDIEDVTVIINYDLTKDIEEYVHRVGRTGRAGKKGLAITLMTKFDWGKSKELVELLEKSGQVVPLELYHMAKRYEAKQIRDKAEGGDKPQRGRGGRGGSRGYFGGNRNFSGNNW